METSNASRRVQRVEKELRTIISEYINTQLRDFLKGIVTISYIVVSKDLRNAKVMLSFLNSDESLQDDFEVITDNAYEIQKQVAKRIRMKFCPKLRFVIDHGFENSDKINSTINSFSYSTEEDDTSVVTTT